MAGTPMHGLTGAMWVPAWAIRPGAYGATKHLKPAEALLFLVLHSRNADFWKPCYVSREDLGATIGISRATVSRHLRALRETWLVFEVDRGIEPKSQRHRPPARWALDPFAAELWRPGVEDALARVAEQDGHDGRWMHRAVTSLDAFERRSRLLAARISEDMLVQPTRRRRRKKGKKRRATAQNATWTQNEPRGDVSTTGEGEAGRSVEQEPEVEGKGKNRAAASGKIAARAVAADADPSHGENPQRQAA